MQHCCNIYLLLQVLKGIMVAFYLVLIFALTFIGGMIPLVFKKLSPGSFDNMLIFSGVFLLGISLFHLFPESWHELHGRAILFVIAGIAIQLVIQKYIPALRHDHHSEKLSHLGIFTHTPIIFGLSVHAFIEGIPLGYAFVDPYVTLYLTLAISYHKIPEAFALTTLVSAQKMNVIKRWVLIILFAAITPISALLAAYSGSRFGIANTALQYIVAMVIGSFIYISVDILLESKIMSAGLTTSKAIALLIGILMVIGTFFLE